MDNTWLKDIDQRYFLRQVEVRPILSTEKHQWNELMAKHHYLGCGGLIGESIRYVATIGNHWVALLGWGSAALHCQVRDRWIGWSAQLKQQRLYLIANNVRFLILPGISIKNLASKLLSLNLKRLSADWQQYHGHPLLLAETFVDPVLFKGTCYKAANWIELGKTKGYMKSAKHYIHHGQPKFFLCRSLHANARALLTKIDLPNIWRSKMISITFSQKQFDALRSCLRSLPEYRGGQGLKHQMVSIMAIAICAILCGAKSYVAIYDWGQNCTQSTLKRLGGYYDRKSERFIAPSERTIRRVLQECDAGTIDQALMGWLMYVTQGTQEPIAVDGKIAKGAKDDRGHQTNLLSAFLQEQGIVIAQREINSKTNEIPEIKSLLNPLDIAGRVVTADALHTQTETAKFIVDNKKADYVFTVKDNQKTLNEDIKALNLERFSPRSRDN